MAKGTSLVAQTVKRLSTMQETRVRSLGWEDPLEKEMAIHSRTIAWKIPWTEELVGYSSWGRKESDTTEQLHFTSPWPRQAPGICIPLPRHQKTGWKVWALFDR